MNQKLFELIEELAYKTIHDSPLNEENYDKLANKQKSIDKLHAPFYSRVKKVAGNGGVRLVEIKPNLWRFTVASGTTKGKKYDDYINWSNLESMVKKFAADKRLWNKDKTKIDLNKLALKIMSSTDLQTYCSCPADLYWGGQYIRTQRGSKYTEPENRPPNIRNPHQYGAYCKHLQLLMDVLPMYASTMSSFLKKVYAKMIAKVEGETEEEVKKVQQAAGLLKQKQEEELKKKQAEELKKHAEELKKKASAQEPDEEEPGEEGQRFKKGSV